MKTRIIKTLILTAFGISTLSANAGELIVRKDFQLNHRCDITIQYQGQKIKYKNFTSAVNTFRNGVGMGLNQGYSIEQSADDARQVNLNDKKSFSTEDTMFANCLSLQLNTGFPFALAQEAEGYLLNKDGQYIDLCWASYDGSSGLSRSTKIVNGEPVAMPEVHPYKQLPYMEFILAKRTKSDLNGKSILSLSQLDLINERGLYGIEGDKSIQFKAQDVDLEAACTVDMLPAQ